jgi:hypothetical protein
MLIQFCSSLIYGHMDGEPDEEKAKEKGITRLGTRRRSF